MWQNQLNKQTNKQQQQNNYFNLFYTNYEIVKNMNKSTVIHKFGIGFFFFKVNIWIEQKRIKLWQLRHV